MFKINHIAQLKVLKKLLFSGPQGFSDLNEMELTSDKFTYHLKFLQGSGYIEKQHDATYALSKSGTEFASRLDFDTDTFLIQPKIATLTYVRRTFLGDEEILLGERLRDPLRGNIGFISAKLGVGKTLVQNSIDSLKHETGLEIVNPEYVGVVHFQSRDEDISDRVMHIFRSHKVTGELLAQSADVKPQWIPLKKLKYLTSLMANVHELVDTVERTDGRPLCTVLQF